MKTAIAQILNDARLNIVANIQNEGITASGRTENSFRVEIYDGGVKLVGGGDAAAPVPTLEIGHDGQNLPRNFTEIIKQWIIDKGIIVTPLEYKRKPSARWQPKYTPEERGLMTLAGAIAWGKIAIVGTDRHINPRSDIYSNVVMEVVPEIKKVVFDNIIKTIKLN